MTTGGAVPLRARLRRLAFGIATVSGLAPRGFFIPYRYAGEVRPAGYPALQPAFEAAREREGEVLDAIGRHARDLATLPERGPARFDQGWFPGLDAAAAYAILRERAPRRVVEIGSGHSTRFLAGAIRDGGLRTEFVAIDPFPRASLAGLAVRHLPRLLEPDDPECRDLAAGDILFVDSSHVAMPGTDLDRLVGDVLPRLPAGILLHLHDVVLPDAYPAEWAWRGYNESIVAAALIGSGGWRVVFSSHWTRMRRPDALTSPSMVGLSAIPGSRETSLWLERV